MESEEPSLQTVLDRKYGLPGPLLVEGRFVIIDGDQATSLVCLGLGSECLVMAAIVFYGNTMDYDLQSLIPLTMLVISYRRSSQILEVRNDIGHTQVFQLCSCINKTEIWNLFISTINKVYTSKLEVDDGCGSTSLTSVCNSSSNTSRERISSTDTPDFGFQWFNAKDFLKDAEHEFINNSPNDVIPPSISAESLIDSSDCSIAVSNYPKWFQPRYTSSPNISLWTADSNKYRIVQPLQNVEFEFEFHSLGSLEDSICTRASSITRDLELESTINSSISPSEEISTKATESEESSSCDAFACLSSSEESTLDTSEESSKSSIGSSEERMHYNTYKFESIWDCEVDEELEFVKRFTSECDIGDNNAPMSSALDDSNQDISNSNCKMFEANDTKPYKKHRFKKFFKKYFLCCVGKKW